MRIRRPIQIPVVCALAAAAAMTMTVAGATARAASTEQPSSAAKPTQVFFMCPHGAGKSVLASAYFQKLAKERGLTVRVDSGGTEPDPAVGKVVVDHLTKNGYTVPVSKPRLVTAADMQTADIVVSLGCKLDGLPAPRGKLLRWDDVPGPGENLTGSSDAIRKHVEALVDELARATR